MFYLKYLLGTLLGVIIGLLILMALGVISIGHHNSQTDTSTKDPFMVKCGPLNSLFVGDIAEVDCIVTGVQDRDQVSIKPSFQGQSTVNGQRLKGNFVKLLSIRDTTAFTYGNCAPHTVCVKLFVKGMRPTGNKNIVRMHVDALYKGKVLSTLDAAATAVRKDCFKRCVYNSARVSDGHGGSKIVFYRPVG